MGGKVFKAGFLCYNNFNFLLLLKILLLNVLEYKAALNLKFKYVCVAMCSLMMSPFSRDTY